jgi:serine/threonine protein kinase
MPSSLTYHNRHCQVMGPNCKIFALKRIRLQVEGRAAPRHLYAVHQPCAGLQLCVCSRLQLPLLRCAPVGSCIQPARPETSSPSPSAPDPHINTLVPQGRDAEAAAGFVDEINLLKRLKGKPNIIQLIDAQVFTEEGLVYMVQVRVGWGGFWGGG